VQASRILAYRIGRSGDCDVRLDHGSVSRLHAELVVAGDQAYYLTDCASSGGTFLLRDGHWQPLVQDYVQPADRLRLGTFETTVEALLRALPRATASPAPGSAGAAGPVGHGDSRPAGPVRRHPRTGEILSDGA
jgi:predicted component of type VI protein secretion system